MNVNELNKAGSHSLQLVDLSMNYQESMNETEIPFEDDLEEDEEQVFIQRRRLAVAQKGQGLGHSMHALNSQIKQLQDDFARLRFYLDEMDESSLS